MSGTTEVSLLQYSTTVNRLISWTKLNKETLKSNVTTNQMGITDIPRTSHSNRKECTFFFAVHSPFTKIDHVILTAHLRKQRHNDITSCILFHCNLMKLDINNDTMKKIYKFMETRKKQHWTVIVLQKKIKTFLVLNKNENAMCQNL